MGEAEKISGQYDEKPLQSWKEIAWWSRSTRTLVAVQAWMSVHARSFAALRGSGVEAGAFGGY